MLSLLNCCYLSPQVSLPFISFRPFPQDIGMSEQLGGIWLLPGANPQQS